MALVASVYAAPIDVASLPNISAYSFKITSYIHAAAALQDRGRDSACQVLLQAAETNRESRQIFVLCRMLFTARGTNEFRRPSLGAAHFFGDTDYADWPLEPIELVDGMPFAIAEGYSGGGASLTTAVYVRDCMTNCDWSTIRFREPTDKQKGEALAKLLILDKWKRPLSSREKDFLSGQIE